MTKQIIGYIRVSTEDQGVAGNGLEAQRTAIERFASDNGYELLEIVQEVASGALDLSDRPFLAAAMKRCQKLKVAIIVSKLDRLSRDAAFILNLMNTKTRFIVAQFGENVDNFQIHIYAILAQKEREMISQRTKDALAILKAKGKRLGGSKCGLEAGQIGHAAQASKADQFALKMAPSLNRMRAAGMGLQKIADELNLNGTKTARGGEWHSMTVRNIFERLEKLEK